MNLYSALALSKLQCASNRHAGGTLTNLDRKTELLQYTVQANM